MQDNKINLIRLVTFFIIVICIIVSCSTIQVKDNLNEMLHLAARKADINEVRKLIKEGADVNYKKQYIFGDLFPLNQAIRSRNFEIVKLLIDHGAKIDTDNDDRSIFDDAIYNKNKNIIQYLLSKGIYVNRSCSSSLVSTALISMSSEILTFVVEKLNVCVNSINYLYGDTPLHETIQWDLYKEASYLIKKGADVNIANKKGQTPLHVAVTSDKIKCVELFLKHGADITIKDEKGMTPLDYAEQAKNTRVVELLTRYKR